MLEAVFDTIGFLLRKCKCLCCSEYHTFNRPLLISTFQIFYEILFLNWNSPDFFGVRVWGRSRAVTEHLSVKMKNEQRGSFPLSPISDKTF
jgi:hypothetical protein